MHNFILFLILLSSSSILLVQGDSSGIDYDYDVTTSTTTTSSHQKTNIKPYFIISTIDGYLHALDFNTGDKRWSFGTGSALVSSFSFYEDRKKQGSTSIDPFHIIPAPDGTLYFSESKRGSSSTSQQQQQEGGGGSSSDTMYSEEDEEGFQVEIERLPLTIQDIVQAPPLRSEDGTRYFGSKNSHVIVLDRLSGQPLRLFSGATSWSECDSNLSPGNRNGNIDNLDNTLWLGRNDFVVRALDERNGRERWNVTLLEYTSFFEQEIHTSHHLPLLCSSVDGTFHSIDRDSGKVLWSYPLNSAVAAVYLDSGSEVRRVAHQYVQHRKTSDGNEVTNAMNPAVGHGVFIGKQNEKSDQFFALSNQLSDDSLLPDLPPLPPVSNPFIVAKQQQFLPSPSSSSSTSDNDESSSSSTAGFHIIQYENNEIRLLPPTFADNGTTTIRFSPLIDVAIRDRWNDHTKWTFVIIGFSIFIMLSFCYIIQSLRRKAVGNALNTKKYTLSSKVVEEEEEDRSISFNNHLISKILHAVKGGVSSSTINNNNNSNGKSTLDGKDILSIGRLKIFSQNRLGLGSHGTVVYEGQFEGRPVAVKRLLSAFFNVAYKEVRLLIDSDHHPNVLRYYATEEDGDFVYLALELCKYSLSQVVLDASTVKSDPSNILRLLREMLAGVAHLHSLNIVHRDIKPQNILISQSNCAKIADMGLGKQLDVSRSSYNRSVIKGNTFESGSIGWQAPEVMLEGRLTKGVDIFSMGCVVFYCLTNGSHPFGSRIERELNIIDDSSCLDSLSYFPEAHDLVLNMIHRDASQRITASEALHHPAFWSDEQKLAFLQTASDRLENEPPFSGLRLLLERDAKNIIGTNWIKDLDSGLLADLNKYRKYDGSTVRDCLRMIRNKKNHYRDLPSEMQQRLGDVPSGFYRYFSSRFPRLLMHTLQVLRCFVSTEPNFREYMCYFSSQTLERISNEIGVKHRKYWINVNSWTDHRLQCQTVSSKIDNDEKKEQNVIR